MPVIPVNIYQLDLHAAADASMLSADERARAERLKIPDVRRRFVAARVGLRRVLAAATGQSPETLTFAQGQQGKPHLTGIDGPPHFNISHSGDTALIAVADVPVGVDVEILRPLAAMDEMAAMAFTDAEREALIILPEATRLPVFFRLWTRKEAVTKAHGAGFRMIKTFSAWDDTGLPAGYLVRDVSVAGACAAVVVHAPHADNLRIIRATSTNEG